MTKRNVFKVFVVLMTALTVIALQPVTATAQKSGIEITPTYSYMWAGSFETIDGTINLKDGSQYGGILSYPVASGGGAKTFVELSYAYLSSTATFSSYFVGKPSVLDGLNLDVSVQYFQLSGIQQFNKGKAQPFIGLGAGAVLFHPKQSTFNTYPTQDVWRMAFNFTAGLKVELSETIALRLQGRLFLPVYFTGGGIFVGTGGASVGVSAAIPIVQGDVGLGLAITL